MRGTDFLFSKGTLNRSIEAIGTFLHGTVNERANIIADGKYYQTVVDFDSENRFWAPLIIELNEICDQIFNIDLEEKETADNLYGMSEYLQAIFQYFTSINNLKKGSAEILAEKLIPIIGKNYRSVYSYCLDIKPIIYSSVTIKSNQKNAILKILSDYIDFYQNIYLPVTKFKAETKNQEEDRPLEIKSNAESNKFLKESNGNADDILFKNKKNGKCEPLYNNLTLMGIALIHHFLWNAYTGTTYNIDDKKADKIAFDGGYKSGQKLLEKVKDVATFISQASQNGRRKKEQKEQLLEIIRNLDLLKHDVARTKATETFNKLFPYDEVPPEFKQYFPFGNKPMHLNC